MLYFHPMPTCHFLKKRLSRHYNMYSCTLDFFPLFEIAQVHFHKKPITNSFTDAYFSALLTEFNFFKYFFFYYQANYFLFSFFYYLVFFKYTQSCSPLSGKLPMLCICYNFFCMGVPSTLIHYKIYDYYCMIQLSGSAEGWIHHNFSVLYH